MEDTSWLFYDARILLQKQLRIGTVERIWCVHIFFFARERLRGRKVSCTSRDSLAFQCGCLGRSSVHVGRFLCSCSWL